VISRVFTSRRVWLGWDGRRHIGFAEVVGVIVNGLIVAPVPSRTVYVVVVGVIVYRRSRGAYEWIVRGHGPDKGGACVCGAETQILRSTVDAPMLHQIDTFEVNGHVDFFTGVCVIAIQPYLEERRADLLSPHFVDEYVCGQFVFVAAVYHQFVLAVETGHCACCLVIGEIEDVLGFYAYRGHHQCQYQSELFHG